MSVTKEQISKSIFALIAAGMLFSCQNDIEEIKALTQESDLPVQIVKNGTFHYTEESKLMNTLKAKELKRFEGEVPRIEVSGGFEMFIYDTLEQVDAILTAEEGTFFDKQHHLEARENVVLVNNEGDSLKTEELFWLQDSNKIYTNKFVEIYTDDGTIFSQGLETDSHFKRYRLKQVTGDILVEEPEKD